MLHFYDRAGFARALKLELDPQLHNLLAMRINILSDDLIDYTEILIVRAGDTEADIVGHIGLSPLVEPIDGTRYGDYGFHPHWDWLAYHEGWFELIFTFGGAFAYVLLIEDVPGVLTELRAVCHTYGSASAANMMPAVWQSKA